MTYSEKLQDPRWQARRLEALSFYEGCNCFGCGNPNNLNVHHKMYIKGKEPWDYEIEDLAILCKNCHKTFHDNDRLLKNLLKNHRLFYSYEFSKIIEIVEAITRVDTNKYIDILNYIKRK